MNHRKNEILEFPSSTLFIKIIQFYCGAQLITIHHFHSFVYPCELSFLIHIIILINILLKRAFNKVLLIRTALLFS